MAANGGGVTATVFAAADGMGGGKTREGWRECIRLQLEDEIMMPVGGEGGDVVLGDKDGGCWIGWV
jgi:hypothetical protein